MSIYHVECVRLNGEIQAFVRIQNDITGTIIDSIRKIHLSGNTYYINADGNRVVVNEHRRRLLEYEDKVKNAIDWYNSINMATLNLVEVR